MSETASDNGKTVAIVAYLTLIGWIVAYIMHNNNKTELGAYHLRQMLGIILVGIALNVIGVFSGISILFWICRIAAIALWALGIIGAFNGEQFQQWFKGIG